MHSATPCEFTAHSRGGSSCHNQSFLRRIRQQQQQNTKKMRLLRQVWYILCFSKNIRGALELVGGWVGEWVGRGVPTHDFRFAIYPVCLEYLYNRHLIIRILLLRRPLEKVEPTVRKPNKHICDAMTNFHNPFPSTQPDDGEEGGSRYLRPDIGKKHGAKVRRW